MDLIRYSIIPTIVIAVAGILIMLITAAHAVDVHIPEVPLCSGTTSYVPYGSSGQVVTSQTIQLTAGYWDCMVAATSSAENNATTQALQVSLSSTQNTLGQFPWTATSGASGGPNFGMSITGPPIRLDIGAPKTYYVNALIYFTGGKTSVRTYYHCVRAME